MMEFVTVFGIFWFAVMSHQTNFWICHVSNQGAFANRSGHIGWVVYENENWRIWKRSEKEIVDRIFCFVTKVCVFCHELETQNSEKEINFWKKKIRSFESYYRKAQQVRRLVTQDMAKMFADGVDFVLTPTCPNLPFKIAEIDKLTPEEIYLYDILTVPASLAGLPAISLPADFDTTSQSPIGMQLIAPYLKDNNLIQISKQLEQQLKFSELQENFATTIDTMKVK